MGLHLIATPIGNDQDISLRALDFLKTVEIIILEEFKESTRFLRAHGIVKGEGKTFEQLNEHSTKEDIQRLADLCEKREVALITDCGTPGFCDPGADLVRECRKRKLTVRTLPGASSLMALLSLSSERLDQFVFRGFLPAENEAREKAWKETQKETRALIIMDTPYRFQKTLQEVKQFFPDRKMLLALDLTSENERVFENYAAEILKETLPQKAEFLALVYPTNVSGKKKP